MGKKKDLTDTEKGMITAWIQENVNQSEIARRLSRNRATISQFVNNKRSSRGKKNSGNKKILTPRTRRMIFKLATMDNLSSPQIKQKLDLSCTDRTIRNELSSNPLIKFVKRKKAPFLTKRHIELRRNWARNCQTWDQEWTNVIFSDEKKFNLDGPDGFQYYYHDLRKEEEYCAKRHNKAKGVMVWAAFGYNGKSKLVFLDGILNSQKYTDILKDNLIPDGERIASKSYIFQQDNAPIHVSTFSKQWFKEKNVKLLEWPPCSPDLNPIENLWGIIVRDIYRNGRQFEDINSLRDSIREAWENIDLSVLRKLIDSMKDRIYLLIEKKGSYTGY